MNNFKINVNRPKITSEEIESKQNFDDVLTKFNQASVPVYKNPWFWGSAGLASLGLTTVLTLNALTPNKNTYDENSTLKSSKNLPPDTECVKPPVKDENVAYQTYQVNPAKDEVITLESGTTITIGENSLVADESKNVEIKVREFHDQASVFISGIPMDYQKSAFQSAGMIEVVGTQDGKEVKINPDKPVEVAMKLHENPEGFDFWFLNQKNKTWEKKDAEYELSQKEQVSNAASSVKILEKEQTQIVKKIESVETKIEQNQKPRSETFNLPKTGAQHFDVDFDKKDFPELQAYQNLIFEVTTNGGKAPGFEENSKKIWSSMELSKKDNQYLVKFKNSKEQYSVNVRPIVQGKDLKTAEKEFDQAIVSYQETKKTLEEEKKKLLLQKQENQLRLDALVKKQIAEQELARKQMADAVNKQNKINESVLSVAGFYGTVNFSMKNWGIYNCDKPKAYPTALKNEPIFALVGGAILKIKQLFVFNLDKKNRYSYGEGLMPISEVGFHKNDHCILIAIDEEGNIAHGELNKDVNLETLHQLIFKKKPNDESTVSLLEKLLDENPALS